MPLFLELFASVAVPVICASLYLGRQLGEIKTSISGVVEDVHEIKAEKLPERMVRVETHLKLERF